MVSENRCKIYVCKMADLLDAVSDGNLDEVVRILPNAKVDFEDENGDTALMLAVYHGYFNIVKLLLQKGADPNIINAKYPLRSPVLIDASGCGNIDIVKEILSDPRTNVNIQNSSGRTALIKAIIYGHTEIVKLLLANGACPNIQDVDGNTALIRVASNDYSSIAKILLDRGADPNLANKNGNTPLSIAIRNGRKHIIELIKNQDIKRELLWIFPMMVVDDYDASL
jgi:ankyrin repeat protein